MTDDHDGLDLTSAEDPPDVEQLAEHSALGTWGTMSTGSTASCPASSAASVMTAS